MPLIKSKSDAAFKSNVAEMIKAGHPRDQALAAAYHNQREAKAIGGGVNLSRVIGTGERQNLAQSGFMHGLTAGRADHVPVSVRANSYVIPADVVSALGQGNSIAGAHALSAMFKMGPYGTPAVGMPHATKTHLADGGTAGPTTDIAISDGEFTVPPEKIADIGGGNIDRGHNVLDAFVKHVRKNNIKTLRKLPGPKKG